MKCPTCHREGYEAPAKGRPKKLDDAKIKKMKAAGKSLAAIADKFGVTRGAIQASLMRSK